MSPHVLSFSDEFAPSASISSMHSSYNSENSSVEEVHSSSMQISTESSLRPKSPSEEMPSDSEELVSQDSLIIELATSTRAKTVNAKAICEPEFLSIVTVGAGAETGASSSPISGRWKQFTDEF